jgi:hypothetical protein
MVWSKFMIEAHAGVPVARLPGSDLVAYLLAQPAPNTGSPFSGWGSFARAGSEEQAQNEAIARYCMIDRSPDCAQKAQEAAARQHTQPPQQRERRGFFQRLFGG